MEVEKVRLKLKEDVWKKQGRVLARLFEAAEKLEEEGIFEVDEK